MPSEVRTEARVVHRARPAHGLPDPAEVVDVVREHDAPEEERLPEAPLVPFLHFSVRKYSTQLFRNSADDFCQDLESE